MTPDELLTEIRSRGSQITVDGEDLRLTGRVGSLTEELRNQIRAQKADVISLLRQEEAAAPALLPKEGQRRFFGNP